MNGRAYTGKNRQSLILASLFLNKIYCMIWKNIYCNLSKYILIFRQIYSGIGVTANHLLPNGLVVHCWKNILCNVDKYILLCWTNTFSNWCNCQSFVVAVASLSSVFRSGNDLAFVSFCSTGESAEYWSNKNIYWHLEDNLEKYIFPFD